MTQTWVSRHEFEEMILSGRIIDGPSITAYALFRLIVDRRQSHA